jgi:hypothetical protein
MGTSPSRVASAEGEAGERRQAPIIERLAFDDKRVGQGTSAYPRRPRQFQLKLPVGAAIRPKISQPVAFHCCFHVHIAGELFRMPSAGPI